jgi:N-acylneuraminate cytidylyltransferase
MLKAEGILPNAMVSIPSTAPLRISQDIDACVSEFETYKPDLLITLSESSRNPYFNMVKMSEDFLVQPLLESPIKYMRRQDCPATYDIATVCYVANPTYILKSEFIFEGNIRGLVIPKERALDIDNLFDFELAEYFLKKRALNE